eukprot:TRINITY_DN351_c0_g1_i1.p1 TRINITY_DN351_c0_g1~~TRINITY_DN351_c0_g1_i1.p1  ORF type:complete len:288 (-),score=31.80 TRINITY_DN351_c0_g1_i1:26-889(-)
MKAALLCGVALVVVAICLVASAEARIGKRWGAEGHEAIAQVASTRLTPAAAKAVQWYLGSQTMEQVAPIPDTYDHTAQGKWSGPLHYVNMIAGSTSYSSVDCPNPPGCVVGAIGNYTQRLSAAGPNGRQCAYGQTVEPCALIFLIHFVGDVHQPLHVGWGADEGGNRVRVKFFDTYTNLHTVWDDMIIERWVREESDLAADLIQLIASSPSQVQQYLSVTDPAAWANESFQLVRNDVYNFVPSNFNATLAKDPELGTWYYNQNLPVVKQRLMAAAVRLAALLNKIFS